MRINKKVQSELINIINVRKKCNLQMTLFIFYRFTTKLVKLTIMLVTGSNSVIVLNKQCLKVRAETAEIAKIFWTFVFHGKWPKNLAFFFVTSIKNIKEPSKTIGREEGCCITRRLQCILNWWIWV